MEKSRKLLNKIEVKPLKKGSEMKFKSATGYFYSNIDRMNYGIFFACAYLLASGFIEAGCKVIVGNRMKNSGTHCLKIMLKR